MLDQSFVFLDRVTENKEKKIWGAGIHNWDDFLRKKRVPGITTDKKPYHDKCIEKAKQHLSEFNAGYFAEKIKPQLHWRLYDLFKDEACYLDIETSGFYGDPTVVGIYGKDKTHMFVRGFTFDKETIKKTLDKFGLLFTFNGKSFDVPVMRRYFGKDIVPEIPHLDLRHICAKIGLRGGLKNIEREVGITRAEEVQNVSGADAVYLWKQWKATKDKEYLNTLVKYNEEDIVNLEPLAEHAIPLLWKQTRSMNG